MKRILLIGIVSLIGFMLTGCTSTCEDLSGHYKRERIVRVLEHRRHHPRRPVWHHRRPIPRPRHRH